MADIEYSVLPSGDLHLIKPLWERLNAHHLANTRHFQEYYRTLTFEGRIRQFSDGKLNIIVAGTTGASGYIGYCIASIHGNCEGEIESLYVLSEYRGMGVGSGLMQRSLDWLAGNGIDAICIKVAASNEEALPFYEKFGFTPRLYHLKRSKEFNRS